MTTTSTTEHRLVQQTPDAWPVYSHPEHYRCSCGGSLWINVTMPVCLASYRTVTR